MHRFTWLLFYGFDHLVQEVTYVRIRRLQHFWARKRTITRRVSEECPKHCHWFFFALLSQLNRGEGGTWHQSHGSESSHPKRNDVTPWKQRSPSVHTLGETYPDQTTAAYLNMDENYQQQCLWRVSRIVAQNNFFFAVDPTSLVPPSPISLSATWVWQGETTPLPPSAVLEGRFVLGVLLRLYGSSKWILRFLVSPVISGFLTSLLHV